MYIWKLKTRQNTLYDVRWRHMAIKASGLMCADRNQSKKQASNFKITSVPMGRSCLLENPFRFFNVSSSHCWYILTQQLCTHVSNNPLRTARLFWFDQPLNMAVFRYCLLVSNIVSWNIFKNRWFEVFLLFQYPMTVALLTCQLHSEAQHLLSWQQRHTTCSAPGGQQQGLCKKVLFIIGLVIQIWALPIIPGVVSRWDFITYPSPNAISMGSGMYILTFPRLWTGI